MAASANPAMAELLIEKHGLLHSENWELVTDLLKKSTLTQSLLPRTTNYIIITSANLILIPPGFCNKYIANTDQDPQNDYLVAQTCFAKKDYDCYQHRKGIISKAGEQTNQGHINC